MGGDGVMAKLGEVCLLKAGKFVSANDISPEYNKGLYPCFGGNGIRGYVADYTHDGEFPLIGRQGALCGNVNLASGKFHATEHAVVVQPKIEMNVHWLYYALNAMNLGQYATGAAQPGLAVSKLETLSIEIPNISEQNKIAQTLYKVEQLVNFRKQQLAKLDELVKVRVAEMFTANESNFPMTALNDLCKEIFAGGDKPSEMSQIQTDEFEFPVYANGYENLGLQGFAKNYRVEEKSVTISARGTIGYSFIREGRYTPIVRLITAVPGDKLNVVYLKYSIDMLDIKSSGTSQAQLTVPNFKKMKIMEPPLPLQNEFATFVARVDQQKQTVQQSLDKLELMKKALMQEYFG